MHEIQADDLAADPVIFVITLCSASRPIPIRVPFVHELVGFCVFRSRAFQEGHDIFRLHVGYFESYVRACEALTVVRRHYPTAVIATAPRTDQSSLDDTSNTSFRMLRVARARIVTSEKEAPIDRGPISGPQHYVVQLEWSDTPISARAVPSLTAFRPYNLYTVRTLLNGGPQYGLRLGFFRDVAEARIVADQAHAQYPHAAVLPVSHREFTRANELIQRRVRKVIAKLKPLQPEVARRRSDPNEQSDL